ncbi:MAG: cytochrome c-type biogenesis protein, partial [Pseudomonadota bacterium]|nr:cytochrome c-type biogenesis protein [Pseudomonadota bacterium]
MNLNRTILFLFLFIFICPAWSYDSNLYNQIIKELRCLVCQNQSLAESDSSLAKDLRNKVKEMLYDGKSRDEIHKYMTERYSDYVLYEPPLNKHTWFLWYGPFIVLVLAILASIYKVRGSRKTAKKKEEKKKDNKKNNIKRRKPDRLILFLIIFIPLVATTVYIFSTEYIRHSISTIFEDKSPVIDVKITINPKIYKKLSGNEIVFVYARNLNGMKVPLAINLINLNKDAKDFLVTLNNTMNMIDKYTLSEAKSVKVIVRITKYKTAVPVKGDYIGTKDISKLLDYNEITI